jgi:oligoribonuclease NrnB/cAMP/cGMP phosphodiesterase (DHH superfamily)
MYPMEYGDEFPIDDIAEDEVVYMLDYVLQPFYKMRLLSGLCRLIWIDHHKSAIEAHEELGKYIPGLREYGRAACELTWEFFRPGVKMPRGIHYLGRYDVWDLYSPAEGHTIINYVEADYEKYMSEYSFEARFLDLKAICVNQGGGGSMSFDSIYNPEKHDVMVRFVMVPSGMWKISLYTTKDDIDCSEIAKSFGGGGHAKAAGFISDNLDMIRRYLGKGE